MNSMFTVILLGLSAEGLVICPFFAFGLTLSDRFAGLRFLSGRIVGLLCFGIIVTLLGKSVPIKEEYVNILFSVTIIVLGVYRIVKSCQRIEFLSKSNNKSIFGLGDGCRKDRKTSKKIGFFLGLFRGLLNPGRKYAYLAPLLIGVGIFKGIALSFAFGVSSSMYLLLGFLSAGFIEKLTPHKRFIGIVGGVILIIMGLLYGWKGMHYFINA